MAWLLAYRAFVLAAAADGRAGGGPECRVGGSVLLLLAAPQVLGGHIVLLTPALPCTLTAMGSLSPYTVPLFALLMLGRCAASRPRGTPRRSGA